MVRAVAGGLTWDTLLETDDPYLDRYSLPMSKDLSANEIRRWQQRFQGAWEVLACQHRWAAGPVADGESGHRPADPALGNRPDHRD